MRHRVTLVLVLAAIRLAASDVYQPQLFKLTSPTNVMSLLGSFHIGKPEMYPLPKPIEDDFEACGVLLLEVYARGDSKANDHWLKEAAFYPEGDSLWKHVSAKTRDRILEFFQRNPEFLRQIGADAGDIAHLRPWLVDLFVDLSPAMATMKTGLGIDLHFQEEAESAGKRIVAIETPESQRNLFRKIASLSERVQIEKLEAQLGMRRKSPAIYDKIVVRDRNVHMANVAEKYLFGATPTFMVVGAAHLGGARGVVHLMQKRGYKVEKVPLSR